MDGDGIPNEKDLDIDADGLENCVGDAYGCIPQDKDCNCNGVPNGQEPDSDSDGIPDSEDQDPYGSATVM